MSRELVKNLCEFIDASYTPYHAVEAAANYLAARGAIRLDEGEAWKLEPGIRYFVVRDGSLIAFMPGTGNPGQTGASLACAHTDSPALKVRLESEHVSKGMRRVGVEVYGGAILAGWFDTPLALSGRVAYRRSGRISTALYDSAGPIGIVPRLAIHLDRDVNKGVEYNAHHHFPVLLGAESQVAAGAPQGSRLAALVAEAVGVEPGDILGADLYFRDAGKAALFGDSETTRLVNASRLDDLAGCHAALEGFCGQGITPHLRLACLLEAEEIGSRTAQGADSSFLRDLLSRITLAMKLPAEDFYRMLARSFCLSIDAAQAWNPSYPEKYDERYSPLLGRGPAVKANANKRYATDAATEAAFRNLCSESGIRVQTYMARADMQPGSTIGPITASRLGIRTVDVGHPLLAMHSIRETLHPADHEAMTKAVAAFFAGSPDFARE